MTQIRDNRPAGNRAATTNINYTANQSIAPWEQDWNEPLTADDRADFDVLIAAAERGFRLAVRCTRCGQWLVARKSVAAHIGPVCATKAVI